MFNIADPKELAELRKKNNPNNEKTGHFTGRCKYCASKDLWAMNLLMVVIVAVLCFASK